MFPIILVACQAPPLAAALTLESAISRGLEQSASYALARRAFAVSAARVREVAASGKPSASASASAVRFDQATRIAFGTGSPPVTTLYDHTETLSVNATQRLDFFGRVKSAVSQAKLQNLADRFAVEGAIRGKRLAVTLAFLGVFKARGQATVAEAGLEAAKNQKIQAKNLFDGGVGQKVDLLRAETAESQAAQNLEAARNAEALARASLADQIGQPLDAEFNLAPPSEPSPIPDVSSATAAALARRDDVLQAETLVRAAELGVSLAQSADRPTVALSAGGSYFPTTSFASPRQRTANVAVSINVPIFDGGLTHARTEEASLRKGSVEIQRDQIRSAIALEIRQAALSLKTADTLRSSTDENARRAKRARDLAEVRYKGQVGLFLELSDAQAALVRADIAASDARYDYLLARARFDAATATVQEPLPLPLPQPVAGSLGKGSQKILKVPFPAENERLGEGLGRGNNEKETHRG